MPNEDDPSYAAWEPALTRELASLDDGAILVAHSVGGTILIHALAEQQKPRFGGLFVLAAPFFGEGGWFGIFGPVFTLGALFLLVRSLMGQAFDRSLAVGYAVMLVFYVSACTFAVSHSWDYLAKAIFNF